MPTFPLSNLEKSQISALFRRHSLISISLCQLLNLSRTIQFNSTFTLQTFLISLSSICQVTSKFTTRISPKHLKKRYLNSVKSTSKIQTSYSQSRLPMSTSQTRLHYEPQEKSIRAVFVL